MGVTINLYDCHRFDSTKDRVDCHQTFCVIKLVQPLGCISFLMVKTIQLFMKFVLV
jgi:hypothetical protein